MMLSSTAILRFLPTEAGPIMPTMKIRLFKSSIPPTAAEQDPPYTLSIRCNSHGEVVSAINGLGEKTIYDYDMLGHPIFEEIFDAAGNPVQWRSNYYITPMVKLNGCKGLASTLLITHITPMTMQGV